MVRFSSPIALWENASVRLSYCAAFKADRLVSVTSLSDGFGDATYSIAQVLFGYHGIGDLGPPPAVYASAPQ